MLKGGSLLYAIFISLIISSIASSFVLFTYYQRVYLLQYEAKNQAINRVSCAITLLRASNIDETLSEEVLLFEDSNQPILWEAQNWGLYYVGRAETTFKKDTFRLSTLLGYQNINPFALYIPDSREELSLAGSAVIKGDVYLSKKGIKRAYVEGISDTGSKLIWGQIRESSSRLPAIRMSQVEYLKDMLRGNSPVKQINFSSLEDDGVLDFSQSFHKSVVELYSSKLIELLEGNLDGKIIIKSDEEIVVGGKMNLQHVVVVAPKVTIIKGFKGKVNIIASDSILIEKECELQYPSSMALLNNNGNGFIHIDNASRVIGEIVLLGYNSYHNEKTATITISANAEVIGNIFSSSNVELKGRVIGSVTAHNLISKTYSSTYNNYLIDGTIDYTLFPVEYVGSGIMTAYTKPNQDVIEWLK